MAYGRKDYFWGVQPDKSVFGELQTPWAQSARNTVAESTTVEVFQYTVSTGYNLQVTAMLVNSDVPGSNEFSVKVDGTVKVFGYFDTVMHLPFGEGGNLLVIGGEKLTVEFINWQGPSGYFVAHGYGFLQQTVV